jgi:hypothetical protein
MAHAKHPPKTTKIPAKLPITTALFKEIHNKGITPVYLYLYAKL